MGRVVAADLGIMWIWNSLYAPTFTINKELMSLPIFYVSLCKVPWAIFHGLVKCFVSNNILISCCLRILYVETEGPTRSGVEQYEGMEVDEESLGDGPGPQRCEY